jgi:hypothetical protein
VVGTRPQVAPLEALEAIAAANDLAPDALRIASSAPEDFILLLPDEDAISRVLRGGGSVSTERFRLLLKRWNRQAHATCRRLLFRADISMGGIPPHAWDLSTAEQLLAPYCWVERLHPATAEQSDMRRFNLTAWTSQKGAPSL